MFLPFYSFFKEMLPNNDKSRIPISITSQRRSTKKAAVEKEVIVVVTPAKLERKNNNNNNNKSNLFSTTCSRMARESKDYNKRPTKSNNNNKKSPLSSTSITQVNKMNKNLRKSPITQLKEDLENLRQKVCYSWLYTPIQLLTFTCRK